MGTGLKPTIFYLIGQRNGDYILPYCKVGIATDMKSRLSGINVGTPFECFVHSETRLRERSEALAVERSVLDDFSSIRVRGEWLAGTPQEVHGKIKHLLVGAIPDGYDIYLEIKPRVFARKKSAPAPQQNGPFARKSRGPKLKPETVARIRSTAESARKLLNG